MDDRGADRLYDELDDIQVKLADIDRILRGDPQERETGIIEELHAMQTEINRLTRLMDPDQLGQGGLVKTVAALTDKKSRREKREGYFWTFAGLVVTQSVILFGLVVVNWDTIQAWIVLHEHIHQAAVIERQTKDAQRKRKKKRKPAPVPETEAAPEPATGEVP